MATSFDGECTMTEVDHPGSYSQKILNDNCMLNGDSLCPDDSLGLSDSIQLMHVTKNKSQPAAITPIVKSTFNKAADKKCEGDETVFLYRGKATNLHKGKSNNYEYDEIGLMCEKDFTKCPIEKTDSRNREVSHSGALKPLSLNEMPPPCKQLYDWAIIPGRNQIGLQIEGHARGKNSSSQLCRTTRVSRVSSSGRKVWTSSGSSYELNGDMLLSASISAGIPKNIARMFLKGLPTDWKRYLELNLLFKSGIKDESFLSKKGWSNPAARLHQDTNEKNPATDEPSMVTNEEEGFSPSRPITRSSTQNAIVDSQPLNTAKKMTEATHIDSTIVKNPKHGDDATLKGKVGVKKRAARKRESSRTTTPKIVSKRRRKSVILTPKTRIKVENHVPVNQTRSGRNVKIPQKLDLSIFKPSFDGCSCRAPVKKKSKIDTMRNEMKSAKRLCVALSDKKLNRSKVFTVKGIEHNSQMKSPKSLRKPPKKEKSRSSKSKSKDNRVATSATHSKNSRQHDEQTKSRPAMWQKCEVVLKPLRRSLCNAYLQRWSQAVQGKSTENDLTEKQSCKVSIDSKSTWSNYKKGKLRKLVNADLSWNDIGARLKAPPGECMEVYNNMMTRKRTKTKTDKNTGQTSATKFPRRGTLKHREHMRQYLDDVMKKPNMQKQDIFIGETDNSSTRNFFIEMCDKDNFVPATPNCKVPWVEDGSTTPAWFKTPTGQSDWASTLVSETPVTCKETWYQRINNGNDVVKRKEADKVILQLGKKMAKATLPAQGKKQNQEPLKQNGNNVNVDGIAAKAKTIARCMESANTDRDDSDKDDYFPSDSE